MDQKIGMIGIICSLNHREVLEEWVKNKAVQVETYCEEGVDLKSILRSFEQMAASVIVIDNDAKGGVNGEYTLINYSKKHPDTKLIFIASCHQNKESDFIRRLLETEQYLILMPRYYAGKKEECKEQFYSFIDQPTSKEKMEELFAKYPDPPKKKLFKKSVEQEVEDVLFSEVRSEFDIPEEDKVDEVDYFRSIRDQLKKDTKEEVLEEAKNEEISSQELMSEDVVISSELKEESEKQKNEHHDDAKSEEGTKEDQELESMISMLGDSVTNQVETKIQDKTSVDSLDKDGIRKLVEDIVAKELKEKMIDFALKIKNITASGESQKTIYVTELMKQGGATRFSLSLAFAYAKLEPNKRVALFFNNDEGKEVIGLVNCWDKDKASAVYRNVHLRQIKDVYEILDKDYDIKIVCLKEADQLGELKPIYDEFYAVISGEPWQAPNLTIQIDKLKANVSNLTFVNSANCSKESLEFVNEVIKSDPECSSWKPLMPEPDFFTNKKGVHSQWAELVWRYNAEKLKSFKAKKAPKKLKQSKPNQQKSPENNNTNIVNINANLNEHHDDAKE